MFSDNIADRWKLGARCHRFCFGCDVSILQHKIERVFLPYSGAGSDQRWVAASNE
jgi:hypothetical protein